MGPSNEELLGFRTTYLIPTLAAIPAAMLAIMFLRSGVRQLSG